MIHKAIVALFLIILLVGATWIIPAARRASQSTQTWRDLQAALSERDTGAISRLISDTEHDLYEVKGNIFYYFNQDFTERLAQSRVNYWRTIEYYMTDKNSRFSDKVVLGGGYALIQTGRVTWIKFP